VVGNSKFPKKCGADILKPREYTEKYLRKEEVYLLLLLIELFLSKVGKHTMKIHLKINFPSCEHISAKKIGKRNGEKMWRGYIKTPREYIEKYLREEEVSNFYCS